MFYFAAIIATKQDQMCLFKKKKNQGPMQKGNRAQAQNDNIQETQVIEGENFKEKFGLQRL